MKKIITSTCGLLCAAFSLLAQPKSDLRPDETVLLYATSFEGNVDPVYGEKIS
jgi:hypothetical protein